jgi:hypothetical protein
MPERSSLVDYGDEDAQLMINTNVDGINFYNLYNDIRGGKPISLMETGS